MNNQRIETSIKKHDSVTILDRIDLQVYLNVSDDFLVTL